MRTVEQLEEGLTKIVQGIKGAEELTVENVNWYSWPYVFGSTSGPHGGIGGCAMTTFQMYGFIFENGEMFRYCAGHYRRWDGDINQKW